MKGKIVKVVAGVYTVLGEDNTSYLCKPRGIFRYHSLVLKTGDNVTFDNGSINEIEERKNDFVRPFIANVDYILLVMSVKKPDFSFELLDRFLINAEGNNTEKIIVITKCDLISSDELTALKETMKYYSKYYKVFYSSKEGPHERDAFTEKLNGKIGVISGQTGSGKSHLLNSLSPKLSLETQEISMALGRGKHTTRQVEIHNVNSLKIADTPGFSSLDFTEIESTDLKEYFPEFREVINDCKYKQCLHIKEPGCKVKELVTENKIMKSRYDTYLKVYNEIVSQKKKYKKEN